MSIEDTLSRLGSYGDVYVIGSYALGVHDEKSDIDVKVVTDDPNAIDHIENMFHNTCVTRKDDHIHIVGYKGNREYDISVYDEMTDSLQDILDAFGELRYIRNSTYAQDVIIAIRNLFSREGLHAQKAGLITTSMIYRMYDYMEAPTVSNILHTFSRMPYAVMKRIMRRRHGNFAATVTPATWSIVKTRLNRLATRRSPHMSYRMRIHIHTDDRCKLDRVLSSMKYIVPYIGKNIKVFMKGDIVNILSADHISRGTINSIKEEFTQFHPDTDIDVYTW